jgi:pyrrolidone-carboxylate peptidase
MTDVQTASASPAGRRARGGGADARRAARTSTTVRQAGFIHVPYLASQIARLSAAGKEIAHGGTLDEEALLRGMKTVIATCAAALSPPLVS